MSLTKTQRYLASIAAATARGDQNTLEHHLHAAFDADGLTIQQAQSALEQLYAYCGFPRSLNALTTLMNTIEERKKSGKPVQEGNQPVPLPAGDMAERGRMLREKLVGHPVGGALAAFAPRSDYYLTAHLFGDIFSDDRLTHQERETVTIAALSTLDGVANQLASHIAIAKNIGLDNEAVLEIQNIAKQI
ncbi:carboxymuconolactone decarboxylase family protein [Neisseria sp. GT4A_CT1]|jgi:carboxymuconolactone decarboxylase|uniref:carboxymuconolactone decarboxylase family protein n=1 Tax=Neisseria sp. GT4A_CT1 TaxID=665946 RepID=UPI00022BEFDF|nr:carboxymuconolactone decarboxylase family protein [Neisseria sp. GT4A_CT1]EGY60447.1 hypothetical protein HMPREF1028_01441 [Neisseria sp. GT4A_CT1]MDU1533597.1 carboxymuconolactone decarboxylase family protein [Neisseria sp.]